MVARAWPARHQRRPARCRSTSPIKRQLLPDGPLAPDPAVVTARHSASGRADPAATATIDSCSPRGRGQPPAAPAVRPRRPGRSLGRHRATGRGGRRTRIAGCPRPVPMDHADSRMNRQPAPVGIVQGRGTNPTVHRRLGATDVRRNPVHSWRRLLPAAESLEGSWSVRRRPRVRPHRCGPGRACGCAGTCLDR